MTADSFTSFSDIIKNKKTIKPPAYPWQDLALRVIAELGVPGFKRNSVFKACKEKPGYQIETALNDTKELCKSGAKWKYFFKIIDQNQPETAKSATADN
ncbi:MAG: hypothetical protein WC458_00565 [Patescibacteria group bacterium]